MTTKQKEVWHLRLVNGDEILCNVFRRAKSEITIKNAMIVDEMKDKKGNSNVFLSKYTLSKDPLLKLKKTHIVTETKVAPEIAHFYDSSVLYSKNIVEPNKLAEIAAVANMISGINKPEKLVVMKQATSTNWVESSNSIN